MDENIELIRRVTSQTHTARTLNSLSANFAPNFTYKDPIKRPLNFKDHCRHMELIRQNCEFHILSIEYVDYCYEMKVEVSVIHSATEVRSKLVSTCRFYIENGIIQKIRTFFYPTPMQLLCYLKNIVIYDEKSPLGLTSRN